LNRCNRAGILSANPIGGINQTGKYRIDVRFNKKTAEEKIRAISSRKSRIELFNLDAVEFIKHLKRKHRNRKFLLYFDPPYYHKGQLLYLNHYKADDHGKLRDQIVTCPFPWLLSYDDRNEILNLYRRSAVSIYRQDLRYSVAEPSMGKELIISRLKMPVGMRRIQGE
jgi:DNA adenine methylase